jgi:hypothetical protein
MAGRISAVGDVNGDGQQDYGGIHYSSEPKYGVFSGKDGSLIRNHTAQNLENQLHGIAGVGDLDRDGYADYGIFGDFNLTEIFSGKTGSSLIQISYQGFEELFPVADVNGNGYTDIMSFDGGCVVIDGSARGLIAVVSVEIVASGGVPTGSTTSGQLEWSGVIPIVAGVGAASSVLTALIAILLLRRRG